MLSLYKLGIPIVHCENFVQQPEAELKKICSYLNIAFDKSILRSHQQFEIGKKDTEVRNWLVLSIKILKRNIKKLKEQSLNSIKKLHKRPGKLITIQWNGIIFQWVSIRNS